MSVLTNLISPSLKLEIFFPNLSLMAPSCEADVGAQRRASSQSAPPHCRSEEQGNGGGDVQVRDVLHRNIFFACVS